jgi:hypothetical protein
MKRTMLATGVCLLVFGVAVVALGGSEGTMPESVTGTWKCMSHGGENGDMPFTLNLQQDGETVTGSVSSPLGGTDIDQASFKDGTLEIHIQGEEDSYTLTAKLEKGELKGKWTHGDHKGTWEGAKAQPETQDQKPAQ